MKRRTLPTVREEKSTTQGEWALYGLVGFVSIACYTNGMSGDFVHDDIPAITMNKDVLAQNPLSHVFKNDFWGTPMSDVNSHKSYRPLTTLTFRANYLMFGLQPFWFHVTNTLLHAAACLLFTRVCLSIARLQRTFAAIAGLLFAVHPIHTEAVTGIVGRADVLACIFFLISLLLYHGLESGTQHVGLSILLGGLSMLAKETGITVFVLNLAFDLYRCWPCVRRTVVEVRWNDGAVQFYRRAAKVILSLALLLAIRLALLQGSLPKFSQQDNPTAFHPCIYVRLLTFCYLAAFNWWLMLCPATLSHDWQMGSVPLVTTVSDSRNLVTCVAFGAALLLLYRSLTDVEQQRHVPVVLGMLLLILPFLPATNLFVTVGFVVAERVLYIPSVGSVLVVTCGVRAIWWKSRTGKAIAILGVSLLLIFGAAKMMQRNKDWRSRETLLRSGISTLPHNAKMHYNFANFLRDSNQPELAITHYNEALRLWPSYASAHNNLGTLMEISKAEKHFLAAIRYSRDHVNAHYNLGKLYRIDNRTQESLKMLERCVKLDPKFVLAYLELVNLKTESYKGPLLKKVISLEPDSWQHYVRYAQWLERNGLRLQSLQMYLSAFSISERKLFQGGGDIVSLRGACLILRSLGQRSRILQLISRWHIGKRWGKASHFGKDIYLHQWKLRQELTTRANYYSHHSLSQEDRGNNMRGRTCLDHSVLEQSSPPRNINEYIVKPQLPKPGKNVNIFHPVSQVIESNTFMDDGINSKTFKQHSVDETSLSESHVKSNREVTVDSNKSIPIVSDLSKNKDRIVINTININSSLSMDTYNSFLRCNKSEMYRVSFKRGRCFYAIRLGNILKMCKKVKCRNNQKKVKNVKNLKEHLNTDHLTSWITQNIVDSL